MVKKSSIAQAVEVAGGVSKLADMLGQKRGTVWAWLDRGQCPPNFCVPIEEAISGKVSRYELRPDIFGAQQRAKARAA